MEKELSLIVTLWQASPVLAALALFAMLLYLLNKAGLLELKNNGSEQDHIIKDLIDNTKDIRLEMRGLEIKVAILLDWKKRDDR